MSTEASIDTYNSLLRGEISAIETYDKAINKYAGEPRVTELQRIRRDHEHNAAELRRGIVDLGGTPTEDSGAWGTFANAVQATTNMFGTESAVSSLLQGEKKGANDYRDALSNPDIEDKCKTLIQQKLLPNTEEHIGQLNALK